jgi:DnaJ-domain-containing protein 1
LANSPATCPACGGVPETPLCCEACGHLLDLPEGAGPFEVFGLEPAFLLDATALRKRMLALSRALHPDFHARAGADTRRRAEDGTAALNAAYRVLVDDLRRADWIVAALGGPGEDQDRSMPTAFLQSVLEWNEAIEAARGTEEGSPERAALLPLARELAAARAEHVGAVRPCWRRCASS